MGSAIKFYDEDDSEESKLIKAFIGGHLDSEITCMSYCPHTRILSSGAKNGTVCIWNCNTNKLEHFFHPFPSPVIGLSFLHPYPLLFVTQEEGHLSLWQLHLNDKFDYKSLCLLRLLSYEATAHGALVDSLDTFTAATFFHHTGDPLIHLQTSKVFQFPAHSESVDKPSQSIRGGSSRSIPTNQSLSPGSKPSPTRSPMKHSNGFVLPKVGQAFRSFFESPGMQFESKYSSADFERAKQLMSVAPQKCHHYYFCLASKSGHLLFLDLLPYLQMENIKPYSDMKLKEVRSRNLMRREENLCVDRVVEKAVEFYKKNIPSLADIYELSSTLLLQNVKSSHESAIQTIEFIPNVQPPVFVACCSAAIVLYGLSGQVRGKISLSKSKLISWNIKFDWIKEIERDFAAAAQVISELEGRPPSQEEVTQAICAAVIKSIRKTQADTSAAQPVPRKDQRPAQPAPPGLLMLKIQSRVKNSRGFEETFFTRDPDNKSRDSQNLRPHARKPKMPLLSDFAVKINGQFELEDRKRLQDLRKKDLVDASARLSTIFPSSYRKTLQSGPALQPRLGASKSPPRAPDARPKPPGSPLGGPALGPQDLGLPQIGTPPNRASFGQNSSSTPRLRPRASNALLHPKHPPNPARASSPQGSSKPGLSPTEASNQSARRAPEAAVRAGRGELGGRAAETLLQPRPARQKRDLRLEFSSFIEEIRSGQLAIEGKFQVRGNRRAGHGQSFHLGKISKQ